MNREELKEYICPADVCNDCVAGEGGTSCSKCNELLNKWLDDYDAKVRADAIDEIKELIKVRLIDNLGIEDATKYGNKNASQQANSYATVMKYEIADCIDDLLDDLEQIKEQK